MSRNKAKEKKKDEPAESIPDKAVLSVHLKPNASQNEVVGLVNETINIRISAPPVDDKANNECLRFLSKKLGIPKSNLQIIKGQRVRSKLIQIMGLDYDICIKRLLMPPGAKGE